MTQTWLQLTAAVDELRDHLIGGRIQKVRQPDDTTLSLTVHKQRQTRFILISCRAGFARISESLTQTATRKQPSALVMWLRKYGRNRPILDCQVEPNDRLVRVRFPDGLLVAELSSRSPNLVALDNDDIVRVSLLPLRTPLQHGLAYQPPAPPPAAVLADSRGSIRSAVQTEIQYQSLIIEYEKDRDLAEKRRVFKGARRRLERRHKHVDADLRRADKLDELKRAGELLKGQLHLVQPGMTEVVVDDWFAEGVPKVALSLDPKLDGPGNVQQFFKRYRKARDGESKARKRLQETEEALMVLQQMDITALTLDELKRRLLSMGLLQKTQAPNRQNADVRKPYRLFSSLRGESIWVGRGGADNHQTTFHHARGNDHWLHTSDVPGAHVVVPCPTRGQSPHPETLKDAAALAVHYSRLRGEAGVAVMHTQRKYLRPVKGGPAGRVTVSSSKTIIDDGDAARVERLFSG
ncbi:MAG: hypothetical protein CMH52_00920 [Myxococcales bacterium]|nr:hypothetical protein [Myxococcales bacterium]